ncbi:MAG: F0F1 ATP synthase subunit A [Clostridiales bacterium]|nr:F0F1 ATP synthase subunit A [Clostridiales bacterium]
MEHGGALFHIGPLDVTSEMTTMLGISILLVVICALATRNMKLIPGGLQNLVEKGVEMLDNFIGGLLSPELKKQYFPLLATIFIFILFCNYSGILPLAGHLNGLMGPTAVLSVTVSMAIVVFCTTHFAGVRAHGFGYLKHFISPYVFLLPLLIIEEFVRPVSLSLRLYGNIYGEEMVTSQLFGLFPIVVPVVMNVFSLLMGGIAAMVFTLLSCIYIEGAAGAGH